MKLRTNDERGKEERLLRCMQCWSERDGKWLFRRTRYRYISMANYLVINECNMHRDVAKYDMSLGHIKLA